MQVNAIIQSTSTTPGSSYGKKINTTISHLRESQEGKARELGIALNALTTNHFEGVQINEINILRTTPTLELNEWQTSASEYIYSINYSGDGDLYVNCNKPSVINTEKTRLAISATSSESFSGTIFATETNNYYSIAKTFERSV